MSGNKKLAGCFGVNDLIFAGHPSDRKRAFAWLTSLREEGIGWEDASGQIEEYLSSYDAGEDHIKEQIERAKECMKFWLDD